MIDEHGKRHASPEAPAIPPHMVDGLTSAAQKKVFGKKPKKHAATNEEAIATTAADSGYTAGAGRSAATTKKK